MLGPPGAGSDDGTSSLRRWPPDTAEPTIVAAAAPLPRRPAADEVDIHARSHRYRAVRLSDDDARARLASQDHGVLCTVHAERGVDAIPVVYAIDEDGYLGVPVDRVKPKASSRLQRERNLEADPRATLLIEHWDRGDWSQLWWVRAELRWQGNGPAERAATLASRLAEAFPPYRDQPFTTVLVLRVIAVTGWSAS